MRLPHVIGAAVAALLVSACAASHNQAQRAADRAEADARAAQKDAREAREETAKAQQQLKEARRSQATAEQDALWAKQRAAQAEWQAGQERKAQPRTAAIEPRSGSAASSEKAKYRVLFPTDSAELTPDAKSKLDGAIPALKGVPRSERVVVEGFTDATGDETHNKALSQQRAEAVAQYLEGKGVASDRITTQGCGAPQPTAKESTADARALDRRVDIAIR